MNTEDQKKFEAIESELKSIQSDLKGTASNPGVFENLRQLQKLVKISIAVSLLGAGSSTVNWDFVTKLLAF